MTKLGLYNRFNDAGLPTVDLIDMREELMMGNRSIFSRRLHEQIGLCLSQGKQIMLLMNRKGFSTHVACRACGFSMKCPDCEIGLTYHKGASHLRCNYCNYRISIPKTCPSCGSKYFKHFGTGTEKVLEETEKLFPKAVVDRLDSETVSRKGGLEQILDRFEKGETDILIGTQMISKGLDFKNVGLVGVIAADLTLNLPDFHAAERTFQLLTQVAGRAGRGDERGHVVIQTYEPDNYAIQATIKHDFERFYKDEIRVREAFKYPPFFEIANVLVSSPDSVEAQKAADQISKNLKILLNDHDKTSYELFDPNPAVYAKIKNRYRWQIVIKYKEELKLSVSEALRKSCFEMLDQKLYSEYLRVIVDPIAQSIL
jgi:primosomal protein N' (replication factor Y)